MLIKLMGEKPWAHVSCDICSVAITTIKNSEAIVHMEKLIHICSKRCEEVYNINPLAYKPKIQYKSEGGYRADVKGETLVYNKY